MVSELTLWDIMGVIWTYKLPTWCFSFYGNCKHNEKITQQVTYSLFPTASSNFWLEEGEKNTLVER